MHAHTRTCAHTTHAHACVTCMCTQAFQVQFPGMADRWRPLHNTAPPVGGGECSAEVEDINPFKAAARLHWRGWGGKGVGGTMPGESPGISHKCHQQPGSNRNLGLLHPRASCPRDCKPGHQVFKSPLLGGAPKPGLGKAQGWQCPTTARKGRPTTPCPVHASLTLGEIPS